jgi:hypothetical protein
MNKTSTIPAQRRLLRLTIAIGSAATLLMRSKRYNVTK